MRTEPYIGPLDELETDLIVSTLFEFERPPKGVTGLIDWRLNGFLSRMILKGGITGTRGEITLLPLRNRLPARRLLLVGLGTRESFDLSSVRSLGWILAEKIQKLECIEAAVSFPRASDAKRERETEKSLYDAMAQVPLDENLRVRWVNPPLASFEIFRQKTRSAA